MLYPYAILDRDGTLIFEPPDTKQVDAAKKMRVLPGVIPGLQNLRQQGFRLVLATNQDGLGSAAFPKKGFQAGQEAFLKALKENEVIFDEIFICPHKKADKCPCRKPRMGMFTRILPKIDRRRSFVLGDRATDLALAKNLGIAGFYTRTNGDFPRLGFTARATAETDITAAANLDGMGECRVATGLNFFDHMLAQIARFSLVDLTISAQGDLKVDAHHTVEDTALALGNALSGALNARRGIQRFGALVPMDDALAEVALDLGGRPYFVFNGSFRRDMVGDLPTELIAHFFRSLSDTLRANIHINLRYGSDTHHKIEAIFKAFGLTLRSAVARDSRAPEILPSTKNFL